MRAMTASRATSPIDGMHIRGSSPRDGSALSAVACTPVDALGSVVARARDAQKVHEARAVHERAALLEKYASALLARAADLESALLQECGKVDVEARLAEILPIADLASFWCDEGAYALRTKYPDLDPISFPGKRAAIERAARGVVALITPWNFPVALPLRTLFPALLAGNAVVFKPSEWSPRSGAILAEEAAKVFGPDLVSLVQGGGELGAALVASGVDAVVFTGSVATGRKVAHAAADALIPAGLELGGKDAAIVLDDAPLERTAQGLVWCAFANAGQNCAAVERVYATPGIAKRLRERMTEIAKSLVEGRDYGPLTTPAQLALVESHVSDAKARGAVVHAGGERGEAGLYYKPTVLSSVPEDASAMCDETFGPIVPVEEVASLEVAIERANASRYGLTASVWTGDLAEGERIARRLRAGVVTVNNHSFTGAIPSLPWAGVGESGYGITNSEHALDLLTRPRTILIDSSRAKQELWWYPYTPALGRIASALIDVRRGGASIGMKLGAVGRLLGGMSKRWKA